MSRDRSAKRFLHVLPVTHRLLFVAGVFVLIVVCLFFLTNARMEVLSAVRSYVGGEGLWSKAQKDAVYHLTRYAHSHDENDYQRFLSAMAIPLGDRQARLELEKPNPDVALVYRGFIQGRVHPEDVQGMASLLQGFRHVNYIARVIDLWAEGDALLTKLGTLGEQLHQQISSRQSNAEQIAGTLEEIDALDQRLTGLEDEFSRTLGEGNRWATQLLRRITYTATALLLSVGVLLSWMMLRQARASEQALNDSRRRLEEDARISAGLARVGRELISSLDTRAILDRLCNLTTELLGCDSSHTVLWNPEDEVFVPVAGCGDPPEHWESMRLLRIPLAAITDLLERLDRDEVVQQVFNAAPPENSLAGRLAEFGITAGMAVALRRGDAIVGYLDALSRGRQQPFSREQERLAKGIGSLASLALANAHLVKDLERANRFRADFVANMSHELRSPLHVIIGYNDLFLDGIYGSLTREQADIVRRISERAWELLDLVNATLDLSRLDAQSVPLERQEVRVATLIDDLARDTRALPHKPGLQLTWTVPEDLPPLATDPLKLKMVLKNLIGNALKFTEQGRVMVSAAARDGGIEFRVTDTGPGIAPEALPIIFEAFRQANTSSMRHGGVGLGLYIVRRLLDILGGTITVDSVVGRGSTFRVWLPNAGPKWGTGRSMDAGRQANERGRTDSSSEVRH